MITFLRVEGFRDVIYSNDHLPAHAHVCGDGEAKINLFGADGAPDLIWADNMARAEIRRAMRIVEREQMFLLQRWKDIHGRDD